MSSPAPPPEPGGVAARYERLVRSGAIERDAAQAALVGRLDALAAALASRRLAAKSSALGWLLGRKVSAEPPPRGFYVHGAVGRGKTMLMDLFFDAAPGPRKRRAHFHAFMADVHRRIGEHRRRLKAGEPVGDDPIKPVAAALADEAALLCFDELAVTDIADAMILGRLFTALFGHGVVVVATSNVAPADLYKDGLNRALFLPFIRLLGERMEAVRLESRTDFRLEKIGDAPVYFTPADGRAKAALDDLFAKLTGGVRAEPASLPVLGRSVAVPAQALGVARFAFEELCARPLGASDYLAIAEAYHTLVVDGIPRLAPERRNEARRFITLVDVLYEAHVKLIASADAPPDALYEAERGAESFEFARTASRLHEMGSRAYLAAPRGRGEAVTGSTAGLVET